MCQECITTIRPDVGTNAYDSGADMTNYKGCSVCKKFTMLVPQIVEDEEDGEDSREIRYQHQCSVCQHVVADHFYSYVSDDKEQVFTMECFLCGRGEHTVIFDDFLNYLQNAPKQSDINLHEAIDDCGQPVNDKVIETRVQIDFDRLQKSQPVQYLPTNDDCDNDEWD